MIKTRYLAGLIPVLFFICGCSDDFDVAARQAKEGANKIAIHSYKAYLAKNPTDQQKAAAAHYEIGVLFAKDNKKEEALLSFKEAIKAGYPAAEVRSALKGLAGDIASPNMEATRYVLNQVRGVNKDFMEYADAQLLKIKDLETTALSLVSAARENLNKMQYDLARENLAKARTLVPGISLPGVGDIQNELSLKEPAYAYEQDLKDVSYVFDGTRTFGTGPNFNSAAYKKYKKLEQEDADKRKEIDDAIQNKALGATESEREQNETTPGRRYQDLLNMRFALRFKAALPVYDLNRHGYDLSGQYEAGLCHFFELKLPVIEIAENRAEKLLNAKTPVQVEIVFNVFPQNVNRNIGNEALVTSCKVINAQASLDGKTVYFSKK
ncbi:MAG: hypothetical protein NTX59_13025 [Elusimicrobia bacterium]|nr:hypothetical protein [Elusimicrobiota bacterium]